MGHNCWELLRIESSLAWTFLLLQPLLAASTKNCDDLFIVIYNRQVVRSVDILCDTLVKFHSGGGQTKNALSYFYCCNVIINALVAYACKQ